MKFCLLGKKLPYSFSKEIHTLNGFDYDLCEVEEENLFSFVKSNGYDGYNVTIPYKESIIKYLDVISSEARKIGSVNTVKKVGGKLFGYNTDVFGMEYALKRKGVNAKNKIVAIAGSGGTYKTAYYLFNKLGAKSVNCVSRNGEINYENCYEKAGETEIFVNATPVGTYPDFDKKVIELSRFNKLEFVFDCVYNPIKTEILFEAEKLKIPYTNGLPMLVFQAIKSESIWTGDESLIASGDKILKKVYKDKGNIVLFGMPSCGKTTIGRYIAEKLNRKFIDTDDLIYKKTGSFPAAIIEEKGEDIFRKVESSVINEIAGETGAVIALGGGAVKNQQNIKNCKRNGVLIYIKRDLELLTGEGRPLSQKIGIKALYEQRKDLYEMSKDISVTNDTTIEKCGDEVIKQYENTCNKRC